MGCEGGSCGVGFVESDFLHGSRVEFWSQVCRVGVVESRVVEWDSSGSCGVGTVELETWKKWWSRRTGVEIVDSDLRI